MARSSSTQSTSEGSTGLGGYEDGYRACPRFWPSRVASALDALARETDLKGLKVLDLGCGEGTNAAWLARNGCEVTAVEISATALEHAERLWPDSCVNWVHADSTELELGLAKFDLIVAYGLLHCLPGDVIPSFVRRMQAATKPSGWNVLATFNDRSQDLTGHPGFRPTLKPHDYYLMLYEDWALLSATDLDLHESHPHNNIPHSHSLTRIVARRPE
ncbi:class I SAM-dependent methyltransferase [Mycolicibacterium pulveris]|uniref:class I SAM-dependent methyltransferase n=1 Tax=Mycolicibacterium pulveris TaxID=36813 RepID=UPI003CE9E3CF